ncbi:MAG: hypothetical protein JRD04_07850 [Deltaproteobacteria bacterium]|nr:hypothetical protein [Deltaproteobacteria bacterium]
MSLPMHKGNLVAIPMWERKIQTENERGQIPGVRSIHPSGDQKSAFTPLRIQGDLITKNDIQQLFLDRTARFQRF